MFRDDIIKRDMKWIREINPHGKTLESWMIDTGYTGLNMSKAETLLKNQSNKSAIGVNFDRINKL